MKKTHLLLTLTFTSLTPCFATETAIKAVETYTTQLEKAIVTHDIATAQLYTQALASLMMTGEVKISYQSNYPGNPLPAIQAHNYKMRTTPANKTEKDTLYKALDLLANVSKYAELKIILDGIIVKPSATQNWPLAKHQTAVYAYYTKAQEAQDNAEKAKHLIDANYPAVHYIAFTLRDPPSLLEPIESILLLASVDHDKVHRRLSWMALDQLRQKNKSLIASALQNLASSLRLEKVINRTKGYLFEAAKEEFKSLVLGKDEYPPKDKAFVPIDRIWETLKKGQDWGIFAEIMKNLDAPSAWENKVKSNAESEKATEGTLEYVTYKYRKESIEAHIEKLSRLNEQITPTEPSKMTDMIAGVKKFGPDWSTLSQVLDPKERRYSEINWKLDFP